MHVRKGKQLKVGCTALTFIISFGNVFVISPQNFSFTIFLNVHQEVADSSIENILVNHMTGKILVIYFFPFIMLRTQMY